MKAFLSVKMDRPIDIDSHYISPGGFEVIASGKSYQFDFNESYGSIDESDSSIIHFELRDEDYSTFPEIAELRKHLHEITELTKCFIYTGEPGEPEIKPLKLLGFEICDYGNGEIKRPKNTDFIQCKLLKTQFSWCLSFTFKEKLLCQAFKEDIK